MKKADFDIRWTSVPKFLVVLNLTMILIPEVNSQLDFFDQAELLGRSSRPALYHCLNKDNLESTIDLIAIEIPSQLMLNGVDQEFPLRKLTGLNCQFGKSTLVLNTNLNYNSTTLPVSHFTPEEGLLFWKDQYYDPALYCIERFLGSQLEISVCTVKCTGPILCFPKCCPFSFIFDPESRECFFTGEMSLQLPSIYLSLERRLPDDYVREVIPVHNVLKSVDCELRQSPYIFNASEFRLFSNGDLYINNSTLWHTISTSYNYCIYDTPPEQNGRDWSHELILYQCSASRKIQIKSSLRGNGNDTVRRYRIKLHTELLTEKFTRICIRTIGLGIPKANVAAAKLIMGKMAEFGFSKNQTGWDSTNSSEKLSISTNLLTGILMLTSLAIFVTQNCISLT